MCGIVGIYNSKKQHTDKKTLSKIISSISYRGPDDKGFYNDNNVSLAHRRLSILDTSQKGHQPMIFKDLIIVLNGEIYNFLEIKKELKENGYNFKSTSDTEVLLKAFHYWGEECINKIRGMFSFATWNKTKKELVIARDRAGIKPLYYYKKGDALIFGSELRAIIKHPKVKRELNFSAVSEFLQFGYITAPNSIYKNIYKLKPGTYLKINPKEETIRKYWSLPSSNHKIKISEKEAITKTESLLQQSFEYRMVSDVPVGLFLSGGIDSSLITTLLQKNRNKPLKTFTMGFTENKWDESKHAKKIANYLGTNHTEFYCSQKDALDIIPRAAKIYDEPFADSSFIPTYLLFNKMDKNIKVVLSGDGGDELFAGYNRYIKMQKLFKLINYIPYLISKPTLSALEIFNKQFNLFYNFNPRKKRILSLYNNRKHLINCYRTLTSKWFSREIKELLNKKIRIKKEYSQHCNFSLSTLQKYDFKNYLPDDILVKLDRASMHNSIEARTPFLGKDVIGFAFQLPDKLKRKKGQNKYILRKIIKKYLPKNLTNRPKKGFSIPLEKWLKSDLKNLLDQYLNKERIEKENIFNWQMINEEKQQFLKGNIYGQRIWNLLIFQIWKEYWT